MTAPYPIDNPDVCKREGTLDYHGRLLVNHDIRIDKLEEGQKDLVGEVREFRKETADRSWTLTLFAIGNLLAVIGGMAMLMFAWKK